MAADQLPDHRRTLGETKEVPFGAAVSIGDCRSWWDRSGPVGSRRQSAVRIVLGTGEVDRRGGPGSGHPPWRRRALGEDEADRARPAAVLPPNAGLAGADRAFRARAVN